MKKEDMVEILVQAALCYIEQQPNEHEIEAYRQKLLEKSELQLRNMVLLNC